METKSKCIYCKSVLTFKEVAEYTGFSEGYLHQLTANQVIPFSKPNGKNIFFSREKLDEWLLSNPIEPKNAKNPRACVRDVIIQDNNNINNQDNNNKTEKREKEILSNESKEKAKKSPIFQVPVCEEVVSFFCDELSSTKNLAEDYYDYYTSCGWKVGNNKSMKDWKSAARRWVRNQKDYAPKKKSGLGYDVATSFDDIPDVFAMEN